MGNATGTDLCSVAVGASAGGVDALIDLVGAPPWAYVCADCHGSVQEVSDEEKYIGLAHEAQHATSVLANRLSEAYRGEGERGAG